MKKDLKHKKIIRNGEVLENLFPEIMIRDLLESHNFSKFGKKQ